MLNAALLATLQTTEYLNVVYKKEPIELKLDLLVPKSDEAVPLLIWIHGGGWQSGTRHYPFAAEYVKEGFAVAMIDYRLSGVAKFPAQIEDCKAAVRFLRAKAADYRIDPNRIGVMGHSAGGHLASLVGTTGDAKSFDVGDHLDVSSAVQAVCAMSGPSDFLQMDSHAVPGARMRHMTANSPESRLLGKYIGDEPELVAKANPITYITKLDPPFCLIHGDQDGTVSPHQSQLVAEALRKVGAEPQVEILAGASHDLSRTKARQIAIAFFKNKLVQSPK